MSSSNNWSNLNFTDINKVYRLRFEDDPVLSSSVVENIRQELTDNYASLIRIQPSYPITGKMRSEFLCKAKSFLNSPNYEGAMKYIYDDYYHFNDIQESHWNVPYSPYLSHQSPGALPPPLCSQHLFPSEIDFTERGVRIKVYTSGFSKCEIDCNRMSDIRVEGFETMIRLSAVSEHAQLDCSQQNYVGRRITRTFHLPDPISHQQLECHYYSGTSILLVQAPWLL